MRIFAWAAALALLPAGPASACPVCVSAPAPSAAAADPFAFGGPLALTPVEVDLLLGRFERRGDHVADPEAEPERHLLSNERVLDFVTKAQVAALRAKPEHSDGDRALAARLYWTRGAALSPVDASFLATLNPLRLGGLEGAKDERSGRRLAVFVTASARADALPASTVDAERAAEALEGLKRVVTRESHGDAAQRDALEDALARLVRTPTGVELAEEFVKLRQPVKIQFSKPAKEGGVVEQNGRKVLQTSGGFMRPEDGQPNVFLNKEYLLCSPGWREDAIAATLAHELLGHSMIWTKAKAAGMIKVNDVYRGDEATAGLVGWLVSAELGLPLSNGHMWRYLEDREDFHKNLHVNLPYYSGTFSRAEMKAPSAALKARRVTVAAELKRLPAQRAEVARDQAVLDHFVKVHGLDRKKVRSLEEGLKNQRVWHDAHEKSLGEIDAYIVARLKHYETDDGRKEAADLLRKSDDRYFDAAEARENKLAARLEKLTAGRSPESSFPATPAGQLSWAEVRKMLAEDKKDNPDHWKSP
jgi:hypothetical protein